MKPSIALNAQREAIRRIVMAHRAENPRVFGSVARGEDTDGSDLDLLIDPTPETSLLDIGAIRHELLVLLGVPVDVVTPRALPEKFHSSIIGRGSAIVTRDAQRLIDFLGYVTSGSIWKSSGKPFTEICPRCTSRSSGFRIK